MYREVVQDHLGSYPWLKLTTTLHLAGCDALNTTLVALMAVSALDLNNSWLSVVSIVMCKGGSFSMKLITNLSRPRSLSFSFSVGQFLPSDLGRVLHGLALLWPVQRSHRGNHHDHRRISVVSGCGTGVVVPAACERRTNERDKDVWYSIVACHQRVFCGRL